jgi:predicted esterase
MSWSTRFPQGPCCPQFEEDTNVWRGGTGCAAGYECASSTPLFLQHEANNQFDGTSRRLRNIHSATDKGEFCRMNSSIHPIDNQGNPIKNKYEIMPRYRTCQSFTRDGVDVYDLPVSSPADPLKKTFGQLAYYSNMGQINNAENKVLSDVTTAIIGVHGSGRDAGTYLCALTATVADSFSDQSLKETGLSHSKDDKVLVVAPWFMAPEDNAPKSSSHFPYIQWDDRHPIPHTFRYGAESIPDANNNTISSFGAMDTLLEQLCDRTNFPHLRRIIVVGHSAGGQFVQRWALSSNSYCFGIDGQFAHRWATKKDLPNVRVVVANPRSFAYLDSRRFFANSDESPNDDGTSPDKSEGNLTPFDHYKLRPPSEEEKRVCKEFNKYEWGLESNDEVPAPYVIKNVHQLIDHGDNIELFCRYSSRDIIYLSGQRDIEELGSQICHGKEDGYQGPSRRERSERFFASLQARAKEVEFCGRSDGGTTQIHDRKLVKNVGHDHALIFQSPEGIQAMFG